MERSPAEGAGSLHPQPGRGKRNLAKNMAIFAEYLEI
jgi:hypothetical protein